MARQGENFYFKSDLFEIEEGEDEQTNPWCFGKQLAEWLAVNIQERGVTSGEEEVIAEDWGWLVQVKSKPVSTWIGCGNVVPDWRIQVGAKPDPRPCPKGSEVTWSCYVGYDVLPWHGAFWARLIGRDRVTGQVEAVHRELRAILEEEPRIELVPEP